MDGWEKETHGSGAPRMLRTPTSRKPNRAVLDDGNAVCFGRQDVCIEPRRQFHRASIRGRRVCEPRGRLARQSWAAREARVIASYAHEDTHETALGDRSLLRKPDDRNRRRRGRGELAVLCRLNQRRRRPLVVVPGRQPGLQSRADWNNDVINPPAQFLTDIGQTSLRTSRGSRRTLRFRSSRARCGRRSGLGAPLVDAVGKSRSGI